MLHLHHNQINSMESARCLSRSLKSHTRITQLHLTHCDLGCSMEVLLVILQSDISHINLDYNNIDSLGAVKIAEYLGDDPPMHSIGLDHNKLNDNDAILINSCKVVIFDNVNLCEEGIMCLSKLNEISLELREFRLHHNRIDNMESARCLSRSLKSHTCVNQLVLSYCDLGISPEILSVLLQPDIKYIDLENNNIDSLGAVKIAQYLERDPPIRRIDLDHNRLNDDDAILISQALKRNMNLKILDLEGNNLTSIGVKALLSCVFDSSSLNAISESNHTLERLVLFTRKSYNLADCIY